jgi:hypothetical protein
MGIVTPAVSQPSEITNTIPAHPKEDTTIFAALIQGMEGTPVLIRAPQINSRSSIRHHECYPASDQTRIVTWPQASGSSLSVKGSTRICQVDRCLTNLLESVTDKNGIGFGVDCSSPSLQPQTKSAVEPLERHLREGAESRTKRKAGPPALSLQLVAKPMSFLKSDGEALFAKRASPSLFKKLIGFATIASGKATSEAQFLANWQYFFQLRWGSARS